MTTAMSKTKPEGSELLEAARRLDELSSRYSLAVSGQQNHFERSMILAEGIQALRKAITPKIMESLLAIKDSPLGFITDEAARKQGPYQLEVIKECAIEAALRGAYWVNNEFNVIAGRCYLAKAYYERKVMEIPKISDLRLRPGVPATFGGGALVPYTITLRLDGKPLRYERLLRKLPDGTNQDERIPVRVNAGMGADAVIGKATRKVLKALYHFLTGTQHTEDALDAAEEAEVAALVENQAHQGRAQQVAGKMVQALGQINSQKVTAAQLQEIQQLVAQLNLGDEVDVLLNERWGVHDVSLLSESTARELLEFLKGRLHEQVVAEGEISE